MHRKRPELLHKLEGFATFSRNVLPAHQEIVKPSKSSAPIRAETSSSGQRLGRVCEPGVVLALGPLPRGFSLRERTAAGIRRPGMGLGNRLATAKHLFAVAAHDVGP